MRAQRWLAVGSSPDEQSAADIDHRFLRVEALFRSWQTADSEAQHGIKEATQIKQHGGKVDTCVRGAVMAVFGLPVTHEDDGLRAVRVADGCPDRCRMSCRS